MQRGFTSKSHSESHHPRVDLELTNSSYRQGPAASAAPDKPNSLTSSHDNGALSTNSQPGNGAVPAALRARRKGAPIHREIVSQLADQMAAATAGWGRGGLDVHEADASCEASDGPDNDDSSHDDDYMEND